MGTYSHAAVVYEPDNLALTRDDRRDVEGCTDLARTLGYERLILHRLELSDGGTASEVVCAHRTGEAWSTWVFARSGKRIVAWSALSGADMGVFPDMAAALQAVLFAGVTDTH